MPLKAKFTRKTIDAAVLALVREKGGGALTSPRELDTALWSSAACFAVFKSMHEVREAIRSAQ